MRRRDLIIGLLLVSGGLSAQSWPAITGEARPAARWWWLGSAVDRENLTQNMQEYAKAGLGGLEITPIYGVQGNDDNNISFLSAKWMEMLRHTTAEGRRLGIEVDMNTGTGWPFGGPGISAANAATKAIFRCDTIAGGQHVELDLSVGDKRQKAVATLSRVMAYGKSAKGSKQCINLTAQVGGDGTLSWDAPAGEWTVVTLHVGKTLQMVKRAAPGGEGYVMDHLSHEAVSTYLAGFDKAFTDNATDYPHTFFNDSYEVYGADWTPRMLEEFESRRGYRLEDHFPEFLAEEKDDTARRIMADYRETMSDLLIENFTKQWTAWAHSHGSITRNQAHGSPANLIDTYAAVDIPECESFGLSQFHIRGLRQDSLTRKNYSDLSMLKYASSAAHISGKKFTSSETFTWLTEHFRTSLSQCKPDMDLMFVAGVNHMFFHGTAYSPQEAKWPGWKFYASIDMSPTNSIWRDAPEFFSYIARCQSFMQMGKPDNDFLVYLPVYDMWQEQPGRLLMFSIHDMDERAPKFIETVNTIIRCGYDMDYISDNFVRTTKVSGGLLTTEGGASYKAIIVPAVKLMPADVLEHLLKLASDGATVIFTEQYPSDVPGYGHLDARRKSFGKQTKRLPDAKEFAETVVTKVGRGRIITGSDYRSALLKSGVTPEQMRTDYNLQCVRRTNDTGHHYFISSLQGKGVDEWVEIAVSAKDAMLFDPMTGRSGRAAISTHGGKQAIRLQLHSGESVILQTYNHELGSDVPAWRYTAEQQLSLSIDHGWSLHFAQSAPQIDGEFSIDEPRSWTEIDHPNATTTMATGVYQATFTLPAVKADDWILDLGDVRESARVSINGQSAGTAWAVPFRLYVGQYLKEGENTITVEVTNLPANRIADMDRRGEKWRIFNEVNVVNLNYKRDPYNNWEPLPSGLNSTVRLIPVDYE